MATGNYSYWKNCLTMIRAGTGITVDNSDPLKPIINATGGGGGGGIESVVAGDNVTVDDTDPLNPIINAGGGLPFKTIMWTAYATDEYVADIHWTIIYNDTGRTLKWDEPNVGFALSGTYTSNYIPIITNTCGGEGTGSYIFGAMPVDTNLIGIKFRDILTLVGITSGSSNYAMRIEIRIYE
jgi:hypothetical protein